MSDAFERNWKGYACHKEYRKGYNDAHGELESENTKLREMLKMMASALEKLQSRHLSCHTMEYKVCDICQLYSEALEAYRKAIK